MTKKKDFIVLKEPVPLVILSLQEVVNLSTFLLKTHSAILYGLMDGPEINPERCERYIEMGKRHNVIADENYMPPSNFFQPFSFTDKFKEQI